jgi:UTP--glucose-1-phosphate uridylyltransferase
MNAVHSTVSSLLVQVITSNLDAVRNRSLAECCKEKDLAWMMQEANALEEFRRGCSNLYHRVRALFFLSALYRYYMPVHLPHAAGAIPFAGYEHLLQRRFEESIDVFLASRAEMDLSDAMCSALAEAYYRLAFQTLADQVRKSVQSHHGNEWMFQLDREQDHPYRVRAELIGNTPFEAQRPTLIERTPVRMDLSHSAWSDIFFLGMDFPEGARVMNVSVDLAVRGRDESTRPPIEVTLRVINQSVLRLKSVDLNAETELRRIHDVFDFAKDYLGLLRAAVVAAGIVPPSYESHPGDLSELFDKLIGRGLGLEITTKVNDIPKGSRLAVSTNLLGAIIAACMRATGQVKALEGGLSEPERRLVAARAILGEWLGGSGGGWQDSGGIWPGIKLICGEPVREGDPEFDVSRGRLLPRHYLLDGEIVSSESRSKLVDSLVLVHGGMAQNVGPVLEMVTEKYLLREGREWQARQDACSILDDMKQALIAGDIRRLGELTSRNFFGPLQSIIPWCSDQFTETLINRTRAKFGDQFWGFWMLGGMAGGGMGFIFAPEQKLAAQEWLQREMTSLKQELQSALPFAMNPVVYDFSINDRGSWSEIQKPCPKQFTARVEATCCDQRLDELRNGDDDADSLVPVAHSRISETPGLQELLNEHGFDPNNHEKIREDLLADRIGLDKNRLNLIHVVEDVDPEDLVDTRICCDDGHRRLGENALAAGQVAIVTLAAGVGSRWTQGAGVVKALHPFCKLHQKHRCFLEIHLAKSRRTASLFGTAPQHVVTTGYMTHQPIIDYLNAVDNFGYDGPLWVSAGKSVGLRMIPTRRDLLFAWEEMPQQILDVQQQKMRQSARKSLLNWARTSGEAADYVDNLPLQCLHPVGHWYEIPNMLLNGTLQNMLVERPQLKYLLLHNVDTLGADLNPELLGMHIERNDCLSFEVIARRLADRGGGLARVDGRPRILEGLAMPSERDEFKLSYYNSMTTWITIDKLLAVFGLTRAELVDPIRVRQAVRRIAHRIPTYITIKDVKKRWGNAHEDIFPVSQFEKLWSDMSSLEEVACGFFVVGLRRGQQLKDQAQLDSWLRDGSADFVDQLCLWNT